MSILASINPNVQGVPAKVSVTSPSAQAATASGVTPGTYGTSALIPIITVDLAGKVTNVTTIAPAINEDSFNNSNFTVTDSVVTVNEIDGGTY